MPDARGAFVRTQFESTVAHFKGQFNTAGQPATCAFDIVPSATSAKASPGRTAAV